MKNTLVVYTLLYTSIGRSTKSIKKPVLELKSIRISFGMYHESTVYNHRVLTEEKSKFVGEIFEPWIPVIYINCSNDYRMVLSESIVSAFFLTCANY